MRKRNIPAATNNTQSFQQKMKVEELAAKSEDIWHEIEDEQHIEFVVTEEQIEENLPDEMNGYDVFQELTEDEDIDPVVENEIPTKNQRSKKQMILGKQKHQAVAEDEKKRCSVLKNIVYQTNFVDEQMIKTRAEDPTREYTAVTEIAANKVLQQEPHQSQQEPHQSQQEPQSVATPLQPPAEKTPADESCPDSIFGELVATMLKKMPPDDKKQAKRNIINILLDM